MKKIILALLCVMPLSGYCLNLQLHYDMRGWVKGKNASNNLARITLEHYQEDKLGSTFFFLDADFDAWKGSMGMAYAEITRTFNLSNLPILAHIEYNGGLSTFGTIPNAYLVGIAYPFKINNAIFNMYVAYRCTPLDKISSDLQYTIVWNVPLFKGKWSFDGYVDFNSQDHLSGNDTKQLAIYSEPSLWYNVITDKLAVGTEVKIAYNFGGFFDKSFNVFPTIGVKYQF